MSNGRKTIYTSVQEITAKNVIGVLEQAYVDFTANSISIKNLIEYEEGKQPLLREKKYRPDINIQNQENLANTITEFKCGYHWSNPITLIQSEDISDEKITKAIAELNKCFRLAHSESEMQVIARYVEITGSCCEWIDLNTDYKDGDSYITITALHPAQAFIIYSDYYIDHRPMMGVSFRTDRNGNRFFTCVTNDMRFEIADMCKIVNGEPTSEREWFHRQRSGEKNPFGIINMVEWKRSNDGMGCFERQIPQMNAYNIAISDFVNDIDQNTQAIWHGNDIEFPEDKDGNPIPPKAYEWLLTETTASGKSPFAKALSIPHDYAGMLNNIMYTRACILEAAYVPSRNDNSGGSTGIAMSDATGWSAAEMIASKQQPLQETAKMREVKVVLEILKKCTHIKSDSDLLSLKTSDIKPNVKRQKTYELTVKMNAICTGIAHGINGGILFNEFSMFGDPNEAWLVSRPTVEAYQNSIFNKNNEAEGADGEKAVNNGRLTQDNSDQIDNSPNIDTTRTDGN